MKQRLIEMRSALDQAPLEASLGVVLYEDRAGQQAFATVHPIEVDEAGQAHFMAGRAITEESLHALAEKLLPDASWNYLPPEVLALGAGWMVWWAEAGTRTLFFETDKRDLGKRTLRAHLPALVFAARGEHLYLYALEKNERPMPGTPLFQVPLYNVWATGEMCRGNVPSPARATPDTLGQWESMVFDTRFTHANDGDSMCRHPKQLTGLWKDIAAGRWKRFPVSLLAPSGITLADLVQRMKGRRAN